MPAIRYSDGITGILLAAGKGSRFDPAGVSNKLAQVLPGGDMVAVRAAKTLLSTLREVVVVVRPGTDSLADALRQAGCKVVQCEQAGAGMGVSLAYAVSHARDAAGWVIALGDMPVVRADTVEALAETVAHGAGIAVPVHEGRRGNPVAFGAIHLPRLLQLNEDQGARALLRECPVSEVMVNDPGIHQDIDTLEDLRRFG
ncbi:nucleotidyltransferase family protein [Noviherbaspirillum massiliense]|uniref:nucleotidyltransferase family protein n=1 Tax=Noviherbaspirillum massiliense TaxID=1465823 RepID=UPI000378DE30|nr:nucleotidyltransferase family protein [Noviherbaspirillum massiliense]